MTRALIIADDLTGAADTAAGFARRGCPAAVSLDGSVPGSAAVAVDTDTRAARQEDAAAAVRRVVTRARGLGFGLLYKKVDSTLRGNVAAELGAFAGAMPGALCVFAPAFPGTGRTTRDGVQLVHGVPLDRSEVWRLSDRPAPRDVPSLLRAAGLAVAGVSLSEIRGSPSGLASRFAAEAREAITAPRIVVCDAETDADLAAIASAAVRAAVPVLWAGSGGLAAHLPLPSAGGHGPPPARALTGGGRTVAVVGSASLAARRQAGQLQKAGLRHVPVSAAVLLRGDGDTLPSSPIALGTALAAGDAVVTITDGEVIRAEHAARAAVAALAQFLAPVLARAGTLILTGGETARAVLGRLGISSFTVTGETEPGVVHGIAAAPGRNWRLVTKAGAFGDEYALVRALHALRAMDGQFPERITR